MRGGVFAAAVGVVVVVVVALATTASAAHVCASKQSQYPTVCAFKQCFDAHATAPEASTYLNTGVLNAGIMALSSQQYAALLCAAWTCGHRRVKKQRRTADTAFAWTIVSVAAQRSMLEPLKQAWKRYELNVNAAGTPMLNPCHMLAGFGKAVRLCDRLREQYPASEDARQLLSFLERAGCPTDDVRAATGASFFAEQRADDDNDVDDSVAAVADYNDSLDSVLV